MKNQVFNPYLPSWEYIPDGEPRVFGNRVYIYGSHDKFNGKGYCENDYVSWSAPVDDLSAWRYEGVIFRKDQTPWNTKNESYYAPDVVCGLDNRYYLYYFVVNSSIISVAVCDEPAGKYQYLGDVRTKDGRVYGSEAQDWFTFDPAVLVDNGRIWLYAGSSQPSNGKCGHEVKGCFVAELDRDMLTMKTEPKVVLPADWDYKKPNFFEGASARHIGEWYYLVYPATNMTGLNYAMSRYPDRDFVHKGAIHSSSDIGLNGRTMAKAAYPFGNSHGGLAEINGQWYIFDHRMSNGSPNCRQAVAEKIHIKEDGMIDMVESTSCGLNEGYLNGIGTYPAYIACHLTGKGIMGFQNPMAGPRVTQDGEDYTPQESAEKEMTQDTITDAPQSYITKIKKECQIGYKYFDLSQTSRIDVTVRGKAGKFSILSGEDGDEIACISIEACDEWSTYGTTFDPQKIKVKENGGTKRGYPIYLLYQGKGSIDLLEIKLS